MAEIKYILAEGWDVTFYKNKEDAESYIEAIDALNKVYIGFDSAGHRLEILPKGQKSEIRLKEDGLLHEEELRNLLVSYLDLIGKPSRKSDLRSLLSQCEGFVD